MKIVKSKVIKRILSITLILALSVGIVYYAFGKVQDAIPTSFSSSSSDNLVIVLDAGHGGMDGGCSTEDGVPEKGINLNIVLDLKSMLENAGYTVVLTRDSDKSIHDSGVEGIANQKSSDMDNRLAIFNENENAICICVHQNKFTDPVYSGAQMFYSPNVEGSQELAQTLQDKFVEFIQPSNTREIKECGSELFLCHYSKNPTVMVECGFLSNPEEAEKLKTEDYQSQVAFTIYAALNQYLANKK